MNEYFPHLFEPIKIGKTTVKNRIFMPPISTNMADKGYVTDALVEHYSARAKGGVGLIVTEVTTVEPVYTYLPGDMSIYDDSYIPGWKKLVDAVHQYDTKILAQLFHPAYMAFPIPGTPQLIAPSNVGPYYAKSAPRAVTVEELHVLVQQFGEAARRFQIAGGDGVEIQCAHAHGLLGGFLTPLYNKRTDEYGGDINGRLRLTLEVIAKIRELCGDDFIIDVRISGDEYSEGGLTLNDMIYVSKQLEKTGVDFIHVSGGNTIKRGSSMPAPGTSPAPHAHASEEIRKHVNIPVSTVARINEPWVAEELIANGKTDICMIGRPNLCDSEFVNKAAEGKTDDIRPCIGCGRCLTGIMFGNPISCTVNPSVESDEIKEADEKKKVLVIGAGPAGMEAAYVAKKRGHEVILCEKSGEFGGLLRLAAVPIAKQELCKVIKFMARRLKNEGIEVRMNCEVTPEMLAGEFKVKDKMLIEEDLIREKFNKPGMFDIIMEENTPNLLEQVDSKKLIEHKEEIAAIINEIPTDEELIAMINKVEGVKSLEDLGFDESYQAETARLSPYVRARITFMRLLKFYDFYEEVISC